MGWEQEADGARRPGTNRAAHAAQAALAVLVVGGVALSALLLHPATGLFGKGRGPLGGKSLLVIGLAVLSLLGGLLLRGRYEEQLGSGRELDPVEQRLADTVSRVLLAAPVIVPLLALALHHFGSAGSNHGVAREPSFSPSSGPPPQTPTPTPRHHVQHTGDGLSVPLLRILLALGILLLVAAVAVAAVLLWRHLTRLPAAEPTATYATLDEEERLAQAVDSGRRALLDGDDARTAVIACYAAMEESLAESGVTRRASDSPQDLLERAVRGGLPAARAATDLTALFREARYSTHPMDDGHRDRAAAALAEIADGLRSRAQAGAEAGARAS